MKGEHENVEGGLATLLTVVYCLKVGNGHPAGGRGGQQDQDDDQGRGEQLRLYVPPFRAYSGKGLKECYEIFKIV